MDATTVPSTWQDALEKHPISSVRAFEKQLRASALRDREKLRALVGSNYRDLLATAEQIVELNNQNREAEASISALSQACTPPSRDHEPRLSSPRAAIATQLRFLDQLLRCTSKATKDRSVSLASKTLIISRLLLKHLEESNASEKTLHWSQGRWKVLRQRLLQCIDSLLKKPLTPLGGLIRAIGAYCLTTSSSANDAIKHFQGLRSTRFAQQIPDIAEQAAKLKDLRQKCHYLIASVTATKALYGRGVAEMLQNLQKQPLLQDEELTQIETLHLDTNRTLLPADVLGFMPYFKRITPSASEVRSSVRGWVNDMVKHLARDIETVVADSNLIGVLRARTQVFSIILPACFSTFIDEDGLALIRETFSKRLLQSIKQQAQGLQEMGSALRNPRNNTHSELLWTSDLIRKTSTKMTNNNLRSIRSLHLGANDSLQTLLKILQKWLRRSQLTREELQNLTKLRWQDKIEEYDDEDEDTAKTIVSGLSKHDPDSFLSTLDSATLEVATDFVAIIGEASSETAKSANNTVEPENITALLRLIRETRSLFKSLFPNQIFQTLADSTADLEEALAQQTATQLFDTMESRKPTTASTFVAEDLPSPVAISTLQQLCTGMSKTGGIDLWTTTAVPKLQRVVLERVMVAEKKEHYVRHEFDEHYLRLALGGDGTNEQNTLDSPARKAAMYWNRTRTLFGMLNV